MECSEAGALLDELALDVLPGDRRAALFAHLEGCPGCRRLLDELSETADGLLLAGPATPPPRGFEDQVMRRMHTARPRPRLRLLAAAAAAVVLLAAGGVAAVHIRQPAGEVDGPGHELRTVRLISTRGGDVGDVSSYAGSPAWFFMRLDGAVPNGTYRCVLDVDDGRTVPMGSLFVSEGKGGWGEHVSIDPRHIRAARLLDAGGTTVATAKLH
jgi:hypothetical protein